MTSYLIWSLIAFVVMGWIAWKSGTNQVAYAFAGLSGFATVVLLTGGKAEGDDIILALIGIVWFSALGYLRGKTPN